MIVRVFCFVTSLMLASPALAQGMEKPPLFERTLAEDVAAEYFRVAEDPSASARLRENLPVAAMLQVLEPHRTPEFGTGVSFYVMSEDRTRGVRLVFRDIEGQDALQFAVEDIWFDGEPLPALVPRQALATPKTLPVKVSIQRFDEAGLSITIGSKTHKVSLGFVPDQLYAQIFCAKAWIMFVDANLGI